MGLWQRLFGPKIDCVWCESKATRSVRYKQLVLPVCNNDGCKAGLDEIVPQCQMLKSFDFPAPPQIAARLTRIRKCARAQGA
jgi:organic radical activating enzyme